MSEEEKEAIEYFNVVNILYNLGLKDMKYLDDMANRMNILLNLIKKQQKEIEKIKHKNKMLEGLLQGNLFEFYLYYKELASKYQANSIKKKNKRNRL